jgi:hypothetical protein
LPAQLRNLAVEYVSLVDRAAVRDPANPGEPQTFLLWKAESGASTNKGDSMADVADVDTAALLKKAERKIAKLQRKLADATNTKPDDDDDDVRLDKSELPQPVRDALEKAEAETEKVRKRAVKAEEVAKAERDLRVEREFVAKAERDYPHVGAAAELGPRLKRMSETLSKEDYEAHLTDLAAANARIETGSLFAELGKSGDPTPAAQDSTAELQRAATALRKQDSNLTAYQAMELALRQDRETQARYLAANR